MNTKFIKRDLLNKITKNIKSGFVNLIYGPRRVGKTVLLEQIREYFLSINPKEKIGFFNGDTEETRELFSTTSITKISEISKNHSLIIIDEAQRIKNISLNLKILVDNFPKKKVFVTGSSSLDLIKGIKEALTGRTKQYKLYPLSTSELSHGLKVFQKKYLLEDQLIYGGYPYLTSLSQPGEKQEYLRSIVEDYLFRDIFFLHRVENPDNLKKLATLLALQIGSEVSLNELAKNLQIDIKTVVRYISLLEHSFIIFPLSSYSSNLRKEIAKSKKYYFYDLGIRNALVNQFFTIDSRLDIGMLWENFLCLERIKKRAYDASLSSLYSYFFWRNHYGAEVDWLEIGPENKISAYEFKWAKKTTKTPKAFKEHYKTETKLVNKNNYLSFI